VAEVVVSGHPNKLRYVHPDGSLEVHAYVEPIELVEPIVLDDGPRTSAGASDRMVHSPNPAEVHPGKQHFYRVDGLCRCGARKS
jgi:hypothetical protein